MRMVEEERKRKYRWKEEKKREKRERKEKIERDRKKEETPDKNADMLKYERKRV